MYNTSDSYYCKFIIVHIQHGYTPTVQATLLITYFVNFKQLWLLKKHHNAPRKEVHRTDIIELIPYHPWHLSPVVNQHGLWFKVSFLLGGFLLNVVIMLSFSFIQISRVLILTSHKHIPCWIHCRMIEESDSTGQIVDHVANPDSGGHTFW